MRGGRSENDGVQRAETKAVGVDLYEERVKK